MRQRDVLRMKCVHVPGRAESLGSRKSCRQGEPVPARAETIHQSFGTGAKITVQGAMDHQISLAQISCQVET